MELIGFIFLLTVPLIPLLLAFWLLRSRRLDRGEALKGVVRGVIAADVLLAVTAALFFLASWVSPAVRAAPPAQETLQVSGLSGTVALAAALATGLATISAGLAVGMTGSAALGTIAERPETFGRALIFVGLAEGIAIYGLIVSFLILSK